MLFVIATSFSRRAPPLHTFWLLSQSTGIPLIEPYVERLRGSWSLPWREATELLLIGLVVYAALRFLEGTRGARLMRAVLVIMISLLVVAIIAQFLGLDRILFLYSYFVAGIFLVALVVFQPELRRGLMRIGERIGRRSLLAQSEKIINAIVEASASLSRRKIGALIAVERNVPTGAIMETGVQVDAAVSRELLETIFWPMTALHDLGVIISEGRVAAAGCEFPLAETGVAERVLGSRHRAALGLSLETDALIVVVSEETGRISVAERGSLHSDLTPESLKKLLVDGMTRRSGSSAVVEANDEPDATSDESSSEANQGPEAEPSNHNERSDADSTSEAPASESPELTPTKAGI